MSARHSFFRTASALPTGEQYTIRHGEQEATVTEVGATLRSWQVAGQELLDTFTPEQHPGSRGQVLLPWPNRVAGGAYEFNGQRYQLAISEPRYNNASHGLTRWMNWSPIEQGDATITLGLILHPQAGYPFLLALTLTYTLTAAGLSVETTAHNLGGEAAPLGAGFHPYFTVGTTLVDDALLQVPAETYLTTDDHLIPTGRLAVDGTDYDFRAPRPIGTVPLDTCYTDLTRSADGWAEVVLAHPAGTPRISLGLDAQFGYLQVYTGDTLSDVAARRQGIAIEPMTCPANAFNSGDGLIVLQPGANVAAQWRLTAEV